VLKVCGQSEENGNALEFGETVQNFESVAEVHRPRIFHFLLGSSRDRDLAETLTQECFLKALRNWTRFRGDSATGTWLIRIAINLQKDQWRSRRAEFWRQTQATSIDLDEVRERLLSGGSSPEAQVAAREQLREVWKAVQQLPKRQQEVLTLRFIHEMDVREIARATNLHEGSVKTYLTRALRRVRSLC
jgi:RNA polymerase sigma-70 factor, ECF subfamily